MNVRRGFHALSFAGGAAVATSAFCAPTLAAAARAAIQLDDGYVPFGVGMATAGTLAIAAAWTMRRVPTPSKINDLQNMKSLARIAFPFVEPLSEEASIPTASEWIAARTGRAGNFSRSEVALGLAEQLGEPWLGIDTLPPMTRGLVALLLGAVSTDAEPHPSKMRSILSDAARRNRMFALGDRDDFLAVNDMCNVFFAVGSEARNMADGISSRHAYVSTAVMGVLEKARESGQVSETQFAWLSDWDRPLAMALNAVGRPSFLVESLGAASHYRAEKIAGGPLMTPALAPGVESVMRMLERDSDACATASR